MIYAQFFSKSFFTQNLLKMDPLNPPVKSKSCILQIDLNENNIITMTRKILCLVDLSISAIYWLVN